MTIDISEHILVLRPPCFLDSKCWIKLLLGLERHCHRYTTVSPPVGPTHTRMVLNAYMIKSKALSQSIEFFGVSETPTKLLRKFY